MARSSKTAEERLLSHIVVDPTTGCWLWTAYVNEKTGYGKFRIGTNAKDQQMEAHRASYQVFIGQIPDEMCVLHRCDVRHCVRPDHLFLGTNYDNTHDMIAKDRHARGRRQPHAKLTDADVIKIRADSRKHRLIANDYNISRSVITLIKLGRGWRHVQQASSNG